MDLVMFSDTHGSHPYLSVPDGDVLIFAGDMCSYGHRDEAKKFRNWICGLPHEHKIVVAGNHDMCFEKYINYGFDLFRGTGIHYLQDSEVVINGIKFYGSPWQPDFCNWAFNLPRGDKLANKWSMIPDDTNVLITHGPPYKILDLVDREEFVGCEDLAAKVVQVKPDLHVFGHIHGQQGILNKAGTTYVNASVLNDAYHFTSQPVLLPL